MLKGRCLVARAASAVPSPSSNTSSALPSLAFPEDTNDGILGFAKKVNNNPLPQTATERLYRPLPPGAGSWPGHIYAANIPDPEDPIVGGGEGTSSSSSPGLRNPYQNLAGRPKSGPRAGWEKKIAKSAIAEDVLTLQTSPPLAFLSPSHSTDHFLGNVEAFAGGPLDFHFRKAIASLHGFYNEYSFLVNPSVADIVSSAFPSSRRVPDKPGVLIQSLAEFPGTPVTQLFQAPLSGSASSQGFSQLPTVTGYTETNEAQPGRLEKEIKYHFATAGVAYRVDGSVSSAADDQVETQVFTDSASHALFWRTLLNSPKPSSFWALSRLETPVVIYHAAGYAFERERVIEEFGGPKAIDLQLAHDKFVVISPYSKPAAALIAGELSLSVLRDITAYLNSLILFDELDVLVIPGTAIYSPATKKAVLYVGKEASDVPTPEGTFIFGAHHLTLSPDGLGRLWNAEVVEGLTEAEAVASIPKDGYGLVTTTGNSGKDFAVTKPLTKRFGDESSIPKAVSYHLDAYPKYVRKSYSSDPLIDGTKFSSKPLDITNLRPDLIASENVTIVFEGTGELSGNDAGKKFVEAINTWGYRYAQDEDLLSAFLANIQGVTLSSSPPSESTHNSKKATAARGKKAKATCA